MTIVTNLEMQKKMFLTLKGISDYGKCLSESTLWTGFSDEKLEGYFVDANEDRAIDTMIDPVPFTLSQPNGEREEELVGMGRIGACTPDIQHVRGRK